MKKTLVLVVDRDDDFGVKGGVETPVIGVESCSVAATALGIADPEDSDINALYAAINIYKDMRKDTDSDNVEVALICGNEKVGHRSDAAIVDELEVVMDRVHPDRIILVGDGAEDEYVYPIISSRVPIDSVRKVYVKQAPGLEGTIYIISKILEDPGKRKRFLAPLGWIIVLISLLYVIPAASKVAEGSPLSNFTTPLIAFLIGMLFILYAYSIQDWFSKWKTKWVSRIKRGSVSVTFVLISSLFFVSGLIIGYLSLGDVYSVSLVQSAAWFGSNALWLIIFAILVYQVGDLFDKYLSTRTIKLSFIVGSINIVAIGLLVTGVLDIILQYYDVGIENTFLYVLEVVAGIALAFISAIVQRHMKAAIGVVESEEAGLNAVS
jgi:putative membrane protein